MTILNNEFIPLCRRVACADAALAFAAAEVELLRAELAWDNEVEANNVVSGDTTHRVAAAALAQMKARRDLDAATMRIAICYIPD